MFEKFSKFHFIPLLCISALFIIGETLVGDRKTMIKSYELICSLDFIFTIIGIGSLIFLYLKTDLSSSRSLHLIIKQGTFGCALALLVYNLFFSVFVCGACALAEKNVKQKELDKFFSDCYLSLSQSLVFIKQYPERAWHWRPSGSLRCLHPQPGCLPCRIPLRPLRNCDRCSS